MSGVSGAREIEEFAGLLREFKERSGLSYGALAKRLHMSTSTLHRYCQGTAVPGEYAPVERIARVCRATPQELVELHRRWVLADAARAARGDQAAAARAAAGGPGSGAVASGVATGVAPAVAEGAGQDQEAGGPEGAGGLEGAESPEGAKDADDADDTREPLVLHVERGPATPRRRRTAWAASAAVAAVLAGAVLVVNPPWDGGAKDAGDRHAAGPATSSGTADAKVPPATPSGTQKLTPSAPASSTPSRSGGAGATHRSAAPGTSAGPTHGSDAGVLPITFRVRPYVYDSPCSQHFLIDSAPQQVARPPENEQDAPSWAAAYGGVSSGEQRIALTVQGTGAETVVLEALHVSVVSKGDPLAWNDYSMGVGCGSGAESKSFDIDLDEGSPAVAVKNGQRDFPYKVSESDPEVFYVTAHSKAYDVSWDLTLDWSSGDRHGTVHVDNAGVPFRTSADVDRPGYDYPVGGGDWIVRDAN